MIRGDLLEPIQSAHCKTPRFERSDTCAVIGNSGSLLDAKHGQDIDQKDCVVRLNAAPIEGYEEDVGSKETYRVLNGPIQKENTPVVNDTPDDYITRISGRRIILGRTTQAGQKNARRKLRGFNNVYRVKTRPAKRLSRMQRRNGINNFGTGLWTVLLFLEYFHQVHIYGFGFYEEDLDQIHYWESYDDMHPVDHEWNKERRYINGLKENGELIVH